MKSLKPVGMVTDLVTWECTDPQGQTSQKTTDIILPAGPLLLEWPFLFSALTFPGCRCHRTIICGEPYEICCGEFSCFNREKSGVIGKPKQKMIEIHDRSELVEFLETGMSLEGVAIQGVDLREGCELLANRDVQHSFFLGCRMDRDCMIDLVQRGAHVMEQIPQIPYIPFRNRLYDPIELFDAFDGGDPCSYCDCTDAEVYEYWRQNGGAETQSIIHGLFQRIHDQCITDALYEFLEERKGLKRVAVMGGHSMKRNDPRYREVALLSRRLTAMGYLMISGGGPGAMEATHLGALLVNHPESVMDEAIGILAKAPDYRDRMWLAAAFEVLSLLDASIDPGDSLGIPTWHYGHEPPTPFASHIAKYFSNSIREEGLITVAHDGIVYAPGSAGTIQEIFQDAAQNHYLTTGYASPMIFLDCHFWTHEKPVYPLLETLARGKDYHQVLGITDNVEGVIEFLETRQPVAVSDPHWSFCSQFCHDES